MNELGNTPADKNYKPSGISKAEEAALKAYPDSTRDGLGILTFLGYTQRYRDCFIKGYEQAEKDLSDIAAFSSGIDGFYYGRGYQQGKKDSEKDLALTWEDVKEIVRIADTMMDFDPHNRPEWMESDKAYYTEVLKQFKEGKQ